MSEEKRVATTCAVGERDGKVILEFPKPVQWAAFTPDVARNIGMAMAQNAYNAKYPGQNNDAKKELTQQLVTKLQTRLTLVIKNLQDRGKDSAYIADEVMNIILREVY